MALSTTTSHLRQLLLVALGQEEIGRRIKEAREAADLTQQELADLVGVKTAQTVSRWERAVDEIPPKRLRRVAEATRKPLSFFVHEVEEPTQRPEDVVRLLEEMERRLDERMDRIERMLQGKGSAGSAP